jgi:hypothetical protein
MMIQGRLKLTIGKKLCAWLEEELDRHHGDSQHDEPLNRLDVGLRRFVDLVFVRAQVDLLDVEEEDAGKDFDGLALSLDSGDCDGEQHHRKEHDGYLLVDGFYRANHFRSLRLWISFTHTGHSSLYMDRTP